MSTAAERIVIVTGAAGGLGSSLCETFAAAGWLVLAAARSTPAPLSNVTPLKLDLARADDIERVFTDVLHRFGRVDALINNAGVTADAAIAQMSEEDWDRVLDVNLRAAFRCSRAVARAMMRQREGHIINISSLAARRGPRGQANYAAAKAGLVGMTQSLARELGSRNIRVNAIFPGVLPTNMTAHFKPEITSKFARANALGRINSVAEVARFIVFLAGTQNISGQVFQLDSRIAPWT